jgi:hypothetical protein
MEINMDSAILRIMHVPMDAPYWIITISSPLELVVYDEYVSVENQMSTYKEVRVELFHFKGERYRYGYEKITKTLVIADRIT